MTTREVTGTVLRAARLYDGTDSAPITDPTILIRGGRIVGVGVAVPPGASVIDLPGATLLPGLVDTHVHLAFDGSEDPVGNLGRRDDAAVIIGMARAARRAALGGVTTVRDLGDRGYLSLALRDAGASDRSLPTIVAAGPPITTPGGHRHSLGGVAAGVKGVRAAVREHAERGVDVIKIMASGGSLGPQPLPLFGAAELRVAVVEAHRHGLPITAYAHGTPAIADAVAAGVDGLEHVTFTAGDGVDPAPVVRTIVQRDIALGLTQGIARVPGEPPPASIANARMLLAAGARITGGTDAGLGPLKPPDVLRWAVGQLTCIGMSPADALRACTSTAAAVCGLESCKGRLAVGYDADVLAVDGDPITDPGALHRIRVVLVRGERIR